MTAVTRAMALKALEAAFDARMESEFRNLADPFAGSVKEKAEAKDRFVGGLNETREAFEFAVGKINEIFPE